MRHSSLTVAQVTLPRWVTQLEWTLSTVQLVHSPSTQHLLPHGLTGYPHVLYIKPAWRGASNPCASLQSHRLAGYSASMGHTATAEWTVSTAQLVPMQHLLPHGLTGYSHYISTPLSLLLPPMCVTPVTPSRRSLCHDGAQKYSRVDGVHCSAGALAIPAATPASRSHWLPALRSTILSLDPILL